MLLKDNPGGRATSAAAMLLAVAALTAAMLIVSCSGSDAPPEPSPQTSAAVEPAATPAAPLPRVKPRPPKMIAAVPPAVPVTPVSATVSENNSGGSNNGNDGELPATMLDPAGLVGLDETATVDLLGRPSTTTDLPPARSWRYASGSCVLDVFFYMDVNTQRFRALSFELTSDDHAPDSRQRCFADILSKASDHAAK